MTDLRLTTIGNSEAAVNIPFLRTLLGGNLYLSYKLGSRIENLYPANPNLRNDLITVSHLRNAFNKNTLSDPGYRILGLAYIISSRSTEVLLAPNTKPLTPIVAYEGINIDTFWHVATHILQHNNNEVLSPDYPRNDIVHYQDIYDRASGQFELKGVTTASKFMIAWRVVNKTTGMLSSGVELVDYKFISSSTKKLAGVDAKLIFYKFNNRFMVKILSPKDTDAIITKILRISGDNAHKPVRNLLVTEDYSAMWDFGDGDVIVME